MAGILCNYLNITRLCSGEVQEDFLRESHCYSPIGDPRPLFCTRCTKNVTDYECYSVKKVPSRNQQGEELVGGFLSGSDITSTNLRPGKLVLHQWTPLINQTINAQWSAGIISRTGPDLILWDPYTHNGKGKALHLPEVSAISEYQVRTEKKVRSGYNAPKEHITNRYEQVKRVREQLLDRSTQGGEVPQDMSTTTTTTGDRQPPPSPLGRSGVDGPGVVVGQSHMDTTSPKDRPNNTLDLLYIMDNEALKVDAWLGGIYQGYGAFEIQKNSLRAWEPVIQNLSEDEDFDVFFATTQAYDVGNLNIRQIFEY